MKRCKIVFIAAGFFVFGLGAGLFADDFVWQDLSGGARGFTAVLVHPANPGIIYTGAKGGIFKSEDKGKSWRLALSLKSEANFLIFNEANKNFLYAATGNGLYRSNNQGRNWQRIFKGRNSAESECMTVAVFPSVIYLGTKSGLLVSRDNGRSWHKEQGKLGSSHILAIAGNLKEQNYPESNNSLTISSGSRSYASQNSNIRDLYVACIDGVFKTQDSGKSWERVFAGHEKENNGDTEEANGDRDERERFSDIRYLVSDPVNPGYLYLATAKGVYQSKDRGLTWQLLSNYGLLDQDVKFLLISDKQNLYAATKAGVFEHKEERWQELSLRLAAGEVKFITLDNEGSLYAVCDKGLFRADIVLSNDDKQEGAIASYNKDEPAINEVQQAAVKYAEVEPEKIQRWRKQAAKKAWLPQVSLGLDRNTTDLWHWESGSTAIGQSGDDLLRRGRDSTDWDVTISWDLGELIWNEDQTSIDVRSKLMVELRQDILDDVTKLYFERLRVKIDIDNLAIEDRKKRLEKELKLQELSASIDALTGGYFSQHLKPKIGS